MACVGAARIRGAALERFPRAQPALPRPEIVALPIEPGDPGTATAAVHPRTRSAPWIPFLLDRLHSASGSRMDELVDELKRHIVSDLELEDVDPAQIGTDDALFEEGLGLDSIDAVELVVMIERHYGIRLTDMQTAKAAFASIRSLAEFVEGHRAG